MGRIDTLNRADRDLPTLAVLALLSTGPRHPYDIHRLLIQTGKVFVTGLPRSLYHAVDKLERSGLIEAVATERRAGRPERTVYELTPTGRQEVRRRVRILLTTPTPDSDITYAALSFIAVLTREEAASALRTRGEILTASVEQLTADLAAATDVEPLLLIESDFELARLNAERDWVSSLVERIESGELRWLDAFAEADRQRARP
ncbi:PadR family transcriptional regulator [Acidipropionibacterium acidipropionici]|uniref:PadR family transcriptional regulator n=1 Tax=Acidipropionibacterium acidipropionici TaxID=1748 RepID=A0AAC8YEP9_9ACTN|nr:PadR family transcriptional regulator [Acidipropionibacterium acidipropionici]AMS05163.1 PadR family transcriptional regulator [Acidipropionibacterium acidipropionici]AOZ46645.1 PadR family transcriptional regulator [Acidipropionibacterium acidipropionici]AZP37291.1 PadR family transcriptional regulator [Acidipropionibacterium acidipropionici]QCV94336.1 PadR family transcriptional regulator [Acidipropionibacterium acidipropionici]